MTYEDDIASTDPEIRASALIERGIEFEQSGDSEAALADLVEAEAVAAEAGLAGLQVAALINRGWVASNRDDQEEAAALYQQAVDLSREHEDLDHLRPALANRAVALRSLERYEEAVKAYDDLLLMVEESPSEALPAHTDRGLCLLELGDFERATESLHTAERLATEAGNSEVVLIVTNALGMAYERNFDPGSAVPMYLKAVKAARELGDEPQLIQALVGLAESHRGLEAYTEADAVYAEAESILQGEAHKPQRAEVMYWHATALAAAGQSDRALELWRAEEALRRELGQGVDLADSLLAQAGVLRARRETDTLPALYDEAEELYRAGDAEKGVADVLYWRAMMARRQGDSAGCRDFIKDVVEISDRIGYPKMQVQARGLYAMALADLGETETANAELDITDEKCVQLGYDYLAVWMFARRAYVYACEGRPAEELTAQLQKAFDHAGMTGFMTAGRTAVRALTAEIKARCGDGYNEALDALQDEIAVDWRDTPVPEAAEA